MMNSILDKINSYNLENKPLIVIDLNSGSYTKTQIGHEYYNLQPNSVDGRYYGYCPPWDNVDIKKLGAKKDAKEVCNVLVVYVTKIEGSTNRKVLAFTDQATVHKERIIDPSLKRTVVDNGKLVQCSYTIESDYLYDLQKAKVPFEINIRKYNSYMFRKQRFYGGKYPELDKELLAYLSRQLLTNEVDDDLTLQAEIQSADDVTDAEIEQSSSIPPQYNSADGSKKVSRNNKLSKAALKHASFQCEIDALHKTFKTERCVPYMEGHHLIPCTASNAGYFWDVYHRNIDCIENIVCLCPTCHRQIHFGSEEEKQSVIKALFEQRKDRLKTIGIKITLKDLIGLY